MKVEILQQVDTLIGFNPVSLLTDSNLLDGVKWNLICKPSGTTFRRPHYHSLQISLESSLTFQFHTLTTSSLYSVTSLTRSEITLTRLAKKVLGLKVPSLPKTLSLKISYLDGDILIFTPLGSSVPYLYSSSPLSRSSSTFTVGTSENLGVSKKTSFGIGEAYVTESEGKDTEWKGGEDDLRRPIKEFK
ncbi:hypothetical protein TrVE_jg366 [Triparma verrucosa]|uniref:Uncharacterized protein n=1 Tax=Triparma verrucosa TaxID=1606542 RepID=A0A9W7DKR7_9STRA|nr:hypothetical protein TrVE_jg366 [Triparma verrucosa]